jgi:hypothetical protein
VKGLALLTYPSRSGSTLLARLVQERLEGVAVTQEVRVDGLLGALDGTRGSLDRRRVDVALRGGHLRHVPLCPDELPAILEGGGAATLGGILERHLAALGHDTRATRRVLLKSGPNLFAWRSIRAACPDLVIVHLVRDPRAVWESQRRTERPHHPGQTIGWYGPLVSGAIWRRYQTAAAAAEAAGVPVLRVAYEALIEDPDREVGRVAGFLDCERVVGGGPEVGYAVPVSERGIHAGAVSATIVSERMEQWRTRLGSAEIAAVEAGAGRAMVAAGYAPLSGALGRFSARVLQAPRTLSALVRRAFR